MKNVLSLACAVALAAPLTAAGNMNARSNAGSTPATGSMTGSGGSLSAGRQRGQSIVVQGVTLSGAYQSVMFSCPLTFFGASTYQWNWTCSGGSVTIKDPSSSIVMSGKFAGATMKLTGAGGGRGGHVSYTYRFSGSFIGTMKQGATIRAVSGSISTLATTRIANGAPGKVVNFSLGW
jgi:hypothetical protein